MKNIRDHGIIGGSEVDDIVEHTLPTIMSIPIEMVRVGCHDIREFGDIEKYRELKQSLCVRGQLNVIQVYPDKDNPGYYVVARGHLRLRAMKEAGFNSILAIIDNDIKDEDMLIDNIQRVPLHPIVISKFINEKLEEGLKLTEIANMIGKSDAYVSNYSKLLSLQNATHNAFVAKMIQDVTAVIKLNNLEEDYPDEVKSFVERHDEISRAMVNKFHDFLKCKDSPKNIGILNSVDKEVECESSLISPQTADAAGQDTNLASRESQGKVIVNQKGRVGVLCLDRYSQNKKHAWVNWHDSTVGPSEELCSTLMIFGVVPSDDKSEGIDDAQ